MMIIIPTRCDILKKIIAYPELFGRMDLGAISKRSMQLLEIYEYINIYIYKHIFHETNSSPLETIILRLC